jgi:hypothetical protein
MMAHKHTTALVVANLWRTIPLVTRNDTAVPVHCKDAGDSHTSGDDDLLNKASVGTYKQY